MEEPLAVALVIGDELLSGHTLDTNSHLLSQRLRAHGIRLARKEVLGDDPNAIAKSIRRTLTEDRPEFLFVVGGIGPTPDDRTYEGVAQALDVPLEVTPEGRRWMDRLVRERGYGAELWADPGRQEPLLRMVRLPRGSRPVTNPAGMALGCLVRAGETDLFVLPGVPREFEAMLTRVIEPEHLESYRATGVTLELSFRGPEAALYEPMTNVQGALPAVRLGSYPEGPHAVRLRVTGPAVEARDAVERLLAAIPGLERR